MSVTSTVATAAALLVAGCDGSETTNASSSTPGAAASTDSSCSTPPAYPAAPDGTEGVVHVAASCSSDGANGSSDHPFTSISAALSAAPEGGTVLVAPGEYGENLVIVKDVAIIGATATTAAEHGIILQVPTPELAGVIVKVPSPEWLGVIVKAPNPEAAAVRVDQGASAALTGLRIVAPSVAGIQLVGANADVSWCRIEGARANASHQFGYGIVAQAGSSLTLSNTAVEGSELVGVLLSDSSGALTANRVADNALKGVRIDGGSGVALDSNEIADNGEVGVATYGAVGIILQDNAITGTREAGGLGVADGIVATALDTASGPVASEITVGHGNLIAGNARVGVLFTAVTRGVIVKTEISDNARGGVWLQNDTGTVEAIKIDGVIVKDNALGGVTVTRGAQATITSSTVSGTRNGQTFVGGKAFEIGDGIGIFENAGATVETTTIEGNGRAGLLIDGARKATTTITGNHVSGNAVGIILQHPRPDGAPTVGANDATGNTNGDVVTVTDGVGALLVATEHAAGIATE